MQSTKSVVISCAGVGSRLGLKVPKCLVEVNGIKLISRHMEMLKEIPNIYVVVGYQASDVIQAVLKHRKDVTFLFNHNYLETGNIHSLMMGSWFHNHDYLISLDGDLILDPNDFYRLYESNEEAICCSPPRTLDPVYCHIETQEGRKVVTHFTREHTPYEWTGLFQIKQPQFDENHYYIYEALEEVLPKPMLEVCAMDIDTAEDLELATAMF